MCTHMKIKVDICSLCNTWRIILVHDRNGTCERKPEGVGACEQGGPRPPLCQGAPVTPPGSHHRCSDTSCSQCGTFRDLHAQTVSVGNPGKPVLLGVLLRLMQFPFIGCIRRSVCHLAVYTVRLSSGYDTQSRRKGKKVEELSYAPVVLSVGSEGCANMYCSSGLRLLELLIFHRCWSSLILKMNFSV